MTSPATLVMVTLDCPDPRVLAEFYHQVTGWEIAHSEVDYAMVSQEGQVPIGFQRADEFAPPRWPGAEVPQQFHLDFIVEDLDATEKKLLAAGAGKPEFQPGGDKWRVLTDPAGHPFCVCLRS
ncbi:VOC family protein [Amycolatopsis sp. CA-230715]|uniref:VOC family protein n=1 Tax=Amycolatopsis sp. CA-230715 TaxID=2745196 RepID=UPI001C01CF16|nr:VOC family protein [Amycolatopsis sp. CA-230715]